MKKIIRLCLILIVSTTSNNINAQEQKQTKEELAWMEYMTPGKMHDVLAKTVGSWSEEITMWSTPDAKPMIGTLNNMNKMIMGNRYVQGMHRGTFNGMPFEGLHITGYDNAKKVFVNSWIDNMGTGIMYSEGKWNEKNNSIEFTGSQPDPVSGKEMKVRQTLKFIDDNNHTYEMYNTPVAGKEFKSIEIKYSRKVSKPRPEIQDKRAPERPSVPQEKK